MLACAKWTLLRVLGGLFKVERLEQTAKGKFSFVVRGRVALGAMLALNKMKRGGSDMTSLFSVTSPPILKRFPNNN